MSCLTATFSLLTLHADGGEMALCERRFGADACLRTIE